LIIKQEMNKKDIIDKLNKLQKAYFKTDKTPLDGDTFWYANEKEFQDILKEIIKIQYYQITSNHIDYEELLAIEQASYDPEDKFYLQSLYPNAVRVVVYSNMGHNIGDISDAAFDGLLYNPIFVILKKAF